MQTVHDRLRLWPEGAFEDMRPELVQAVTLGESMDDTTKRVAGILEIDAPPAGCGAGSPKWTGCSPRKI